MLVDVAMILLDSSRNFHETRGDLSGASRIRSWNDITGPRGHAHFTALDFTQCSTSVFEIKVVL